MCAENHRRYFDKNAKALVKKLVTADLSKRYGNLKAGSDDILGHSWFKGLDLKKMEAKEITPPYKPQVQLANCQSIGKICKICKLLVLRQKHFIITQGQKHSNLF